jgi:uncharacterized protein YggE
VKTRSFNLPLRRAAGLASLTLAALVLSSSPSLAQAPIPGAPTSDAPRRNPGSLNVTGQAQVLVVPDQIELRLGIRTQDLSLTKAKADNDTRSAAVLAKLREQGLPAKDVQTDALHVSPEYHHPDRQPPVLVTHHVQRHVVVTLRNVAQFEAVVQGALEAGANEIMNIQFCTTELRKHRDLARQNAIRAAREKAVLLATELGAKVGRPTQITEQGQEGVWSSYHYYGYGGSGGYWQSRGGGGYGMQNSIVSADSGGSSGVPEASTQTFAPGQIRITAQVSVTFELE